MTSYSFLPQSSITTPPSLCSEAYSVFQQQFWSNPSNQEASDPKISKDFEPVWKIVSQEEIS